MRLVIAQASSGGAAWTSVIAAAVFLLALVALVVDRARMKRRLAALERSEALLETDLADARREVDDLRACLRDRTASSGELGSGATSSDPGAPVT